MTPLEQSTLIYQHWMINLGVIQAIAFFLAAIIAGWVGHNQTKISNRQVEISADLKTMQATSIRLAAVSTFLTSVHNQLRYPNLSLQQTTELQGAVGTYHQQLRELLEHVDS